MRGRTFALGIERVLGPEVAARDRALDPARNHGVLPVRFDRGADRVFEPQSRSRHQALQLVVVRDEIVLEALDQRLRDADGHGRHQAQPVRRQARRQHRDRHDPRGASDQVAVAAHDRFVRHGVGAAGIERLARRVVDVGDRDQVGEQVVERDRRRDRLHPARRHHDGQVIDQVADDFVRGGAGSDDHAGAQFGHRDAAGTQDVTGFGARAQMFRAGVGGDQPAEVDDAPDARRGRCRPEVARCFAVQCTEAAACGHRMHQVIGDVDALQRGGERLRLQGVGGDARHVGPAAGLEHLDVAGGRADALACGQQARHQVGADVAARAENELQ